jgi:hypothetical protein
VVVYTLIAGVLYYHQMGGVMISLVDIQLSGGYTLGSLAHLLSVQ